MKTLSRHIFQALIPGFLITLLVSGWIIKTLITADFIEEFDKALENQAQALMAITELDEDGVELDLFSEVFPMYFAQENPDYFSVLDLAGEQLFSSESLKNNQLPEHASKQQLLFRNTVLPDGRMGRYHQRQYFPRVDIDDDEEGDTEQSPSIKAFESEYKYFPAGETAEINGVLIVPELLSLTLAISREPLEDKLSKLNLILILTGLVTIAAVVLLQRLAIHRAVLPIQNINKQIQALDVHHLDQPITLTHPILELDILTKQFNGLMQRVNEGFARERRFSANVAHEIRTPITELKTLVDVKRRWPTDPTIAKSYDDDLHTVITRMERLIENLLALGRGDTGQIRTSGEVDLVAVVNRTLSIYQTEISERSLRIQLESPSELLLAYGADQWPLIVNNLIDNAIEYSSENTVVQISLTINTVENTFSFAVTNDAPDLESTSMDRLIDRLWRKDESRTNIRHNGLGLALVDMYTKFLNHQLSVDLSADKKITVKVSGSVNVDSE